MSIFADSLKVLEDLFSRDFTFVLATAKDNIPSTRVVDTYYEDGVFWVVTYAKSRKVQEITENPHVALCNDFNCFQGKAENTGHPLNEANKQIRQKLIKVFEPWYFAHNNEDDAFMCYVKIVPESGFFHKDGKAYKVDFINKTAEKIPFAPDIESIS